MWARVGSMEGKPVEEAAEVPLSNQVQVHAEVLPSNPVQVHAEVPQVRVTGELIQALVQGEVFLIPTAVRATRAISGVLILAANIQTKSTRTNMEVLGAVDTPIIHRGMARIGGPTSKLGEVTSKQTIATKLS